MKDKLYYLALLVILMLGYESYMVLSTESLANSTEQFLDDRSSPLQILKSYYNAINRKEYVRAYYYWGSEGKNATSQPSTYPDFKAGYANTTAVQLKTGNVKDEPGAGNVYYQVPVTLVATHTDGSKHTYVGCYGIRQANPKLFEAPPFVPMNITSAKIKEVSSQSNTSQLMNQSCG